MMFVQFLQNILILGFTVLLIAQTKAFEDCTANRCRLTRRELKFGAIGDWGGLPIWPYRSPVQWKVAEALADKAREENFDFYISLGDNFYLIGVKNDRDKRFRQETFEKVYSTKVLQEKPWYIMAGNHDHNGNVTAQIAYSRKSDRWIFPKPYYMIKYQTIDGIDIDIIVIDTVILCGNTVDGKFDSTWRFLISTFNNLTPDGPSDPKAADDQWQWIEDQLNKSRAHYLFVAGHYPVYSIADHGPTKCLIEKLDPLMQKFKVTAYISGHDHNLQHLQIDSQGSTINYVLSGSGAFSTKSTEHAKYVPPKSSRFVYPSGASWLGKLFDVGKTGLFTDGGFVSVAVDQKSAVFDFLSGEKKLLYRFEASPRF
uniref:Tartrate-resistant acid phosphatase type 5 n=1 Tax=Romanomermis culicivorax TaxID=13658 RepID=A0A915KBB5_ROMCU